MKSFVPGPDQSRAFRTALGAFPTGVTIVTAGSEIGPIGMTANSFTSVSLDPPLILWCPARDSRRFDAFANATEFAIHVLSEEQNEICERFSKIGHDFSGLEVTTSETGVPLIEGCPARFECVTQTSHDGGDHTIVVARVTRVTMEDGGPMVFARGSFGGFTRNR